jgi:DUF1707 SHOCT-like domain
MTESGGTESGGTGGGGLRIGTAERNSAMKALDEHLNEGRLGVEEYADRSAVAANATTAAELRGLFTDLPEPHPVLPGDAPAAAPASVPAAPPSREVAQRDNRFLQHVAPRVMAVVPIVALVLFLVTHQWWWFLLIPAAGAVLYGGHGHDHSRDREERRRDRDERRARRYGAD